MRWGEKRYHSLDYELKQMFKEKVYKIALNGGMTCPNRDGHVGTGGCIFCSSQGSGDFAGSARLSIAEQIKQGKADISSKRPVHSYIAYFQAFTNTYAPVETLRALYMEAIADPEVKILSFNSAHKIKVFCGYSPETCLGIGYFDSAGKSEYTLCNIITEPAFCRNIFF